MRRMMGLGLLVLAVVLAGCATERQEPARLPVPLPEPPPAAEVIPPSAVVSLPPDELARLEASDPVLDDISPTASAKAMAAAYRQAQVRPRREWFRGAVLTYPYHIGSVYTIPAKEHQPTVLVFESPERVQKARGPDDWWEVEMIPREDPDGADYVRVTPKASGQELALAILTTRGVYHVQVQSTSALRVAEVHWSRPPAAPVVPQGVRPGVVYLGYDIFVEAGQPPWMPIRAWDTQGRLYLEVPPEFSVAGAPNIYARDGEQRHVVNWTVQGSVIGIDRVDPDLELRIGDHGARVRVRRGPNYRAIRCPVSPECPSVATGGR